MEHSFYQKIINQYDTPIYIVDESELGQSVSDIESAFSDFPTEVHIAYPYKTNSLKKMCEYMKQRNLWTEVSSGMEMQMALKIGVEPEHIIFNSPYKSQKDLTDALTIGCLLNVDNMEEFKRILSLSEIIQLKEPKIGIRVSTTSDDYYDKFGFSLENEALEAVTQMVKNSNVRITGIHVHRSSIPTLEEYKKHIDKAIQFSAKIIQEGLAELEYIDIGSGFTVEYPQPLRVNNWTVPTMEQYVDILSDIWKKASLPENICLIVEPGKRMVASCVTLLAKIVSIKNRPNGKICFLNIGHNLMPGVDWCRHPISQLKMTDSSMSKELYDLHGCLCDNWDILQTNVPLLSPESGDVLCIGSVGGYDMSRSFVWQIPRAPVLWTKTSSDYEVVRIKEDIDYLWQFSK